MEEAAASKGTGYLYEKLKDVDPESAESIHSNDMRRIIRALEIYELTGVAKAAQETGTGGIGDKYTCMMFGLHLPRPKLYERIEACVDSMFDAGLVEEVKALIKRELSLTAEKALGIKELGAYLAGEFSIEDAREELKKNTRRYAKRQLTWFRGDERIFWLDADRAPEEISADIAGKI